MAGEARGDCPKVCECKWKDGKEAVSCVDASFIDIPKKLESTTQVLDLTGNNLKILPKDAFQDAALLNLQKVWLKFCKLTELKEGSFRGLSNLVELDLSDNQLETVPMRALKDVSGLRELRMARNHLTSLPSSAFTLTPDLIKLNLGENRIASIMEDAFKALSRLEVLHLGSNLLKIITMETMRPLVALHGLNLHGNPWVCDCHLRPLRRWMTRRNVAEAVPSKCNRPKRLRDRKWQSLTLDEFVCVPSVTAVAPRVLAAHGDNVSLACKLETDLDALVTWLVGDRQLDNTTATETRRYRVLELMAPDHNARLSNLTIAGAAPHDQGTYRCVAENKAGRSETNLTLQVSKEIIEVPRVALNKVFMAGAVLGGGVFFVVIIVLLCAVIFRRRNLRQRQRRAKEEFQSTLTSNASLSGAHSSSRIHLNSIGTLHDEDEDQSIAMTETKKHPKLSDYHIVPTSEVDSSPILAEASGKSWVVRDTSMDEFVISKDLEKPAVYSDKDSNRLCEQAEEIEPRKKTSTSADSPRKVSYVEIPKAELSRDNFDEKTKWKDLAYQSKEVALQRDYLRQQEPQQSFEGPLLQQEGAAVGSTGASLLRSSSSGGSANFPDLLDLPQTQQTAAQQQMQVDDMEMNGASTSHNYFSTIPRRHEATLRPSDLTRREAWEQRYLNHIGLQHSFGAGQRSSSTLALPLLEGEATTGGAPHPLLPHTLGTTQEAHRRRAHMRRHPSLPTSPVFEDRNAFGELLAARRADYLADASRILDPNDPYRYEYHAAQLDKFLQEYKTLQQQLYRMKESCEKMKRGGSMSRVDLPCDSDNEDSSLEDRFCTPYIRDGLPIGGAGGGVIGIAGAAPSERGGALGGPGGAGGGISGLDNGGGTLGGITGEPLKSILKKRREAGALYRLGGSFGDELMPLETTKEPSTTAATTKSYGRDKSSRGAKHRQFDFYDS
ncbi:uncharacterized protein LOC143018871 [Oratosquilla oratoria]|uniref:uncharacterized protein LOC143018871 n=1 Tax=Oratosquilla oratoria TaxID=337810 RepID=UPI003F761DAB